MFYVLSKILWLLVQPLTLALLLLLVGLGLSFTRWRWSGRLSLGLAALILLAGGFTNLGFIAIERLERVFERPAPPAAVDGIIVLGGGMAAGVNTVRQGYEMNRSGDRFVEALRLAFRYPSARVIVTGGPNSLGEVEPDVAAARRFFAAFELDPARLVFEDASRNTAENVELTRALMAPAPGDTYFLVTSAYHMPRAMGLFRKAGVDVIAWPTDYMSTGVERFGPLFDLPAENLSITTLALREWIGLLAYWLTGRIDELLPGPVAPPA